MEVTGADTVTLTMIKTGTTDSRAVALNTGKTATVVIMEIARRGLTITEEIEAEIVAAEVEEEEQVATSSRSDEQAKACRSYHLKVSGVINLQSWLKSIILFLERDAGRPKLNLAPRTVKDPVNALASTKQAAAIFGDAKPREEKVKDDESVEATESS